MFRCITELKGLVVDIDSFGSGDKAIWIDINSIIPCVFISADKNTREYLSILFGAEKVIAMKKFEKIFAPNKVTHARVLTVLKVQNTEVAYLSASHEFLKKANSFLCGSIWVTDTDRITYEQASESPDLIIESLTELKIALQRHVAGFYGEMLLFPGANFPARMLPVDFNADDDNDSDIVPMYVLGRYYGYAHYMNQLHPYSSAIYLNKKTRRTYTGVFDKRFESIYSAAVNAIKPAHKIDCICAVPVKPGKTPRFDNILNGVASTCGIENIGKQFICIHNYSDQKSLSKEERNKNVRGAFSFAGDLTGRTVVLIDDISSTGSTLRECIRVLRNSGAQEVVVIVLAINQNKLGAYWSLDNPQVTMPRLWRENGIACK
ncbi:MAG: ComF family protein [Anaerovoracaceae bacterium]